MTTSNVSKTIRTQMNRPSVRYANVKICSLHAHRRTILISVMMMSNVSKAIRAQMDWPSVRHAQCQNMPSTRAQADKPDIHHDDVEHIQSNPHANGLAFCPLCSTSKYVLCTRTGGYIKVPFLALILACPPHARKRVILGLTRTETPRCTSPARK